MCFDFMVVFSKQNKNTSGTARAKGAVTVKILK